MTETWRGVPRSEWFERIILTVDSCRGEGEALGDEATMRRCDEQIEFLEDEIVRAKRAEMQPAEVQRMIRGVWATPTAREEFSSSEREDAVRSYGESGPQYFSQGAGFAVYEFSGGRRLMVAEQNGLASLMTCEEVDEERERLGLPKL